MRALDFEPMEYNPIPVLQDGKLLWEVYPVFKKYDVFWRHPLKIKEFQDFDPETLKKAYAPWRESDSNMLLAYVILSLDVESPYRTYRDLEVKNREIFKLLQIGDDSLVHREIMLYDPVYEMMCTRFFRIIQNEAWEIYLSLKMAFQYYNEFIRRPPKEDDIKSDIETKTRAQNHVRKLEQQINQYHLILFPEDTRTRRRVVESLMRENDLGGVAEEFAQENPFGPVL